MRQVEGDQVVAQQAVRAAGESVQPRQPQAQAQRAAAKGEGLFGLRAHRGEGVDAAVPAADFEIQREAAQRKAPGVVHQRRSSPGIRDFVEDNVSLSTTSPKRSRWNRRPGLTPTLERYQLPSVHHHSQNDDGRTCGNRRIEHVEQVTKNDSPAGS